MMRQDMVLAAFLVLLLAACGGGGGSAASPPAAQAGGALTGTTGCTIAEAASSCEATIKAITQNAASPRLAVGGSTVSTSAFVDLRQPISHGTVTVTLSDGSTKLDEMVISGECITGTAWDSTACTRPVQHYSSVTVSIRFGYPVIITMTGPVDALNQTSYQSGFLKLFNCLASEEPQPSGIFLELCQTSDGAFHYIAHDVRANVLTDYNGPIPTGLEFTTTGPSSWTFGPKWHACMRNCFQTSDWGTPPFAYMSTWADDGAGGYFYTDLIDNRILRHQTATGDQAVLYTSSDGGAFAVMRTISN